MKTTAHVKPEHRRQKRPKTLLSLAGSITKKQGEKLLRITTELRKSWR